MPLTQIFAEAMDRLGPFEDRPYLAAAVSGGADSMALTLLADAWVRSRDGRLLGLIVDHGLRAESAEEAGLTLERLAGAGIDARVLTLTGLTPGPALAERARQARYAALAAACREAGCLHLLLGHHAGDQAETLAMRVLRGSRDDGLAGMAAVWETPALRLLRPLLEVDPLQLRAFLTGRGMPWVEDPSNRNRAALRPRLRMALPKEAAQALRPALRSAGLRRAADEAAAGRVLAEAAIIRPEGFALVRAPMPAAAWASLIRTIGGAAYPPDPDLAAGLARQSGPMTLAGVRIAAAGRLGQGWLVLREEAAIAAPVHAGDGAVWDGRFRLLAPAGLPEGAMMGALGSDAPRFRRGSDLPSAILRTLPALRIGKTMASVPHLGYVWTEQALRIEIIFSPPRPAAGPVFHPAASVEAAVMGADSTSGSGLGAGAKIFGCAPVALHGPSGRVGM